MAKKYFNWDFIGITASVACAIHCAVLPLVVTSLPLFGINIVENEPFEYGMIFLAIIIGIYSLRHGYIKHHKNINSIILFSVGALFLLLKQAFHHYQYFLLPPAVLFIVWAHYKNYKLCQQCSKGCKH